MTRFSAPLVVVVVGTVVSACGGGQQNNAGESPAPAPVQADSAPVAGASQNVDIQFTSQPNPPQMGENTFEVMVMSGGQPVADAEVAVEFYMPAMPSMNMAEMRNSVPLKHEGNGRYRGTGNVMMAGEWQTTVTVRRAGQELGRRQLSVTAK